MHAEYQIPRTLSLRLKLSSMGNPSAQFLLLCLLYSLLSAFLPLSSPTPCQLLVQQTPMHCGDIETKLNTFPWAWECASEQTNECSRAQWSAQVKQAVWSKGISGASEQANGQGSGPVLMSWFLTKLNHSSGWLAATILHGPSHCVSKQSDTETSNFHFPMSLDTS